MTGTKVIKRDGYTVTENASLKPRKTSYLPDGTIDFDGQIGDEPDIVEALDAMADLHTGRTRSRGRYVNPDDPIQSERERREVDETMALLHQNLWGALNEKLNPQGIVVAAVGADKDYGIKVFASDSERRPCDVTITMEKALEFIGLRDEGAFRELADRVAVQILNAREQRLAEQRAFEAKVMAVAGKS